MTIERESVRSAEGVEVSLPAVEGSFGSLEACGFGGAGTPSGPDLSAAIISRSSDSPRTEDPLWSPPGPEEIGTLSKRDWRRCLDRIIDRLEAETGDTPDGILSGALEVASSGSISPQLKAMVVPLRHPVLLQIIRKPVYFPDVGVILHPGEIPSPEKITLQLAGQGTFPTSFLKLQETVAEILTWPLWKRVGSFAVSCTLGLLTLPLNVAVRVALWVPRILGVSWLKRNHLALFVDPALESAFADTFAVCQEDKDVADLPTTKPPSDDDERMKCAIRTMQLLHAMDVPPERVGALMNGARYDKKQRCFPKLEEELTRVGAPLGIVSEASRDALLARESREISEEAAELRVRLLTIAREEIDTLLGRSRSSCGSQPSPDQDPLSSGIGDER